MRDKLIIEASVGKSMKNVQIAKNGTAVFGNSLIPLHEEV